MEQEASAAMLPQEPQPFQLPQPHWLQVLQRPQEQPVDAQFQGAQGLQAGVPSLRTQPELLQPQVLPQLW